ncbi:MAG: hypothetical protein WD426_21050 [Anditalea sp.]
MPYKMEVQESDNPWDRIKHAMVKKYRPIIDYGGWAYGLGFLQKEKHGAFPVG